MLFGQLIELVTDAPLSLAIKVSSCFMCQLIRALEFDLGVFNLKEVAQNNKRGKLKRHLIVKLLIE